MKSTILIWVARAGFDKETRAVLGHHSSALQGVGCRIFSGAANKGPEEASHAPQENQDWLGH